MKVYISYSYQDHKSINSLFKRLSNAGHELYLEKLKIKPSGNFIEKVYRGVKEAQVLIVIISGNSLRSKWELLEFSALALADLTSERRRVIPVLIDSSTIPSYLSKYAYFDLTLGEKEVNRLISSLDEYDSISQDRQLTETENDQSIKKLSQAYRDGRLTLVCGAGISVCAGIPSWDELLHGLLKKMMTSISSNKNLSLKVSDANEFQRRYATSALILGKYLKSNLGKDYFPELRCELYKTSLNKSDIIEAIVELSRPQRDGKTLDSLITFNFDDLVEEALGKERIKYKTVCAEGVRSKANELPIYHVHGYLPRKGRVKKDNEIVFSEEAYHSQFIDPFSWSNLIQLNKLSQKTCLFIGLSLTDPNLRRLLDVANRKNPSNSINHFIIKKTPVPRTGQNRVDDLAEFLEEQDANELGLNVIWVNKFEEIAPLVKSIASSKDV